MSIYYLRMSGSDSNNGTSAATAWRTFGKLLSSAGIASGDTCYVGAGVYREIVTINMVSATAETFIIGDFEGFQTGDAGEIQWTTYLVNDETLPSTTTLLAVNGKDFLTFKNISFVCPQSTTIGAANPISKEIKFINCSFQCVGAIGGTIISLATTFGVSANHLISNCMFLSMAGVCINIALATGVGSDYNANILIQNCSMFSLFGCVSVTSSGVSANEGGGVKINNCFMFFAGNSAVTTTTLRVGGNNFTYPVIVYNCFFLSRTNNACNATELGALIENNNIIISSVPRLNVNIGPQTVADSSLAPPIHFGQEKLIGKFLRPFGMPTERSPLLGHADVSLTSLNDILGIARPDGVNSLVAKGTATSATNLSLTDTSKNFGSSGNLNGYTIKIVEGAGAGQTKTIWGNTASTISGDGAWLSNPDNTSKYVIFQGQTSSTGPVSGDSSAFKITSSGAKWGNNFWQGYTCLITSGAAAGNNFIVSGNSSTSLTGYYTMNTSPATGDAYLLYWGAILKSTVSTATSITLTDNNANWPSGFWNSWRCMITSGNASGANFAISGCSANTLSGWNTFAITPTTGNQYVIYQNTGVLTGYYASGYVPNYGQDFIQCAAGCYERSDTAIKETGIAASGANSIQIFGPGTQDFLIAISGQTTVSVMGYFDAQYQGPKPQLVLNKGSGIGVADITGQMTVGSGMWEQISLSINSSLPGYINAQLRSNTTGCCGSCYWDSFSIV